MNNEALDFLSPSDVAIERHRADAQLSGQGAHRERHEAVSIDDGESCPRLCRGQGSVDTGILRKATAPARFMRTSYDYVR